MAFSDRFQKTLDRCVSLLGETAIYTSKESGSVPVEIAGIPSRESIDIVLGQMAPGMTRRATLGVNIKKLNDLGIDPKEGDLITLRSINFKIKAITYDGEGGAEFTLSKT